MRWDSQMADPDSPSPAEVPQGGRASMVPPDGSCDAGPSRSTPSPDTELQAGGRGSSCAPERTLSPGLKSQTGPGGEEGEEEEEEEDRAAELHLHRDVAAGPHRPIGGQSLTAVSHMTAAASCPTVASSVRKRKQPQEALCCSDVAGRRMLLLSNEARREIAKQARAMKEERRAALDGRHQYLISRLVDAGTLQQLEVEDALICDDKVLFTPLPVVHVYAVSGANMADRKQHGGHVGSILYSCPVYKKPQRTDQNFIFCLQLRSVQPADHWTLRGTALLCDCK